MYTFILKISVTIAAVFVIIFIFNLIFTPTQTVKMTPEGFQPDSLTIKEGTSLTFVNEDVVDRWPASDFHPTHKLYPEFDPQKAIRPKNTWSLNLTKNGSFKYHDHLYPHQKGIIIVQNTKSPLKHIQLSSVAYFRKKFTGFLNTPHSDKRGLPRTDASFLDLSEKEQQKFLEELAQTTDLAMVWEFIVNTFSGKVDKTGRAHDLAHFLGDLIYQKKGLGGLNLCGPNFGYGCHHGFAETAFQDNFEEISQIEKGCREVKTENPGRLEDCLHGLGHGITAHFAAKDLNNSLKACDKLKANNRYCYDGVFMAFSQDAPKSFYLSSNNPLFPCDKIKNSYQISCAKSLPQILAKHRGMNKDKIKITCQQFTNIEVEKICINSLQ